MKKKSPEVSFRMSFAVFIMMVKTKLSFIRRDIIQFLKYGVTEPVLVVLDGKITEFDEIPTDEELVGAQGMATEAKDAQAVKVRAGISSIMTRAANTFGTHTSKYRRFGINGISDLIDQQLLISARRVNRVGRLFVTELAPQGLSIEILDDFKADFDLFDDLLIAQENAIADRDDATENRIEKANAIYHEIVKYCENGKRIWESVNEAKYNDYIIYDTPSGEPEEPPV